MGSILAAEVKQSATGAADGVQPATVLHSHHYNTALQRALLETERVAGGRLIERVAAEVAHREVGALLGGTGESGPQQRLRRLADGFRTGGLGALDLSQVAKTGGTVEVASSHFALGWQQKFGKSKQPVCHTTAGYLAGALAALFGHSFVVEETACAAQGAARCTFAVAPSPEPIEYAPHPEHRVPVSGRIREGEDAAGAEIREMAREALAGASLRADAEGRMGMLGTPVSRLWTDYYTALSYRFELEVPRALGPKFANLASIVLTEAGHQCAFHTLGGILKSEEWEKRVAPRLRTREAWVYAMTGVLEFLGWGVWRVETLVPGERLTVRVYDSYEGVGYRRQFGPAAQAKCYLARGTAATLMNLLYVGDITTRPALTPAYYNQVFRSPLSFRAIETRCRAADDPYCEFVVNPLSPSLAALLSRR